MDSNEKMLINDSTARPTHVRYWVIVFAVTLSVITYIDRVCISQAAPLMSKDLGFSTRQMGWAFSAIVIGYILAATNHNWNIAIYAAAGVYFFGTFCWLVIDPVTPIETKS
ncbi:MAG: hypothetical protein ABSG97_07880 [Sedimentisphaerales bacterium]|jgi:sugar phosphate permease